MSLKGHGRMQQGSTTDINWCTAVAQVVEDAGLIVAVVGLVS